MSAPRLPSSPSPSGRRFRLASLSAIVLLGACNAGHPQTVPVGFSAEPDGGGPGVVEEVAVKADAGSGAQVEGTVMVKPGPTAVEMPAPAPPATVRISVRSSPRASVTWGRKSLGSTPLSMERARDSGPMDLVLSAGGYLPLHTRAYTFRNDSVSVQLTPLDKKDTLLGARKAPPAPPPGAVPDGGVPPP